MKNPHSTRAANNCINCNSVVVPQDITDVDVQPDTPNLYSGTRGTTPFIIYTGILNNIPANNYTGPMANITSMNTIGDKDANGKYILPSLDYAYTALEPYIDTQTMQIHHDKHHQKYIDELNKALAKYPEFYKYTLEQLIANSDRLPNDIRNTVMDNAGGNYNHTFFWKNLSPSSRKNTSGNLESAIENTFGSMMDFYWLFKQVALSSFGSGWAWLLTDPYGKLIIATTSNQNTPIPLGLKPLIVIDLWEHAYYLKNQNKRNNYIDNWFNVVNFTHANELYSSTKYRK